MNFLEICRAVASDVGVAGASNGNVPATTVAQQGELRRIVGMVQDAWLVAQAKKYDFLVEELAVAIATGTNATVPTIALAASRYKKASAYRLQAGSNAKSWLDYVPWDDFRYLYDVPWLSSNTEPTCWSIRQGDNAFVVNAKPTLAPVTVYVERFKRPTKPTADTDVPPLPDDLHQLIVELAKIRYANADEAGAMRQTTQIEVTRLTMQIDERCLPEMTIGDTLIDE